MNALQKFFQEGFTDQLTTAGELITLVNPKTKESTPLNAVVTENSGNTSVEIGSVLYQVDAHVLIPADYNPTIGHIVKTAYTDYKIISKVKSTYEAAWSCNLIKI